MVDTTAEARASSGLYRLLYILAKLCFSSLLLPRLLMVELEIDLLRGRFACIVCSVRSVKEWNK